MDSTQEEDAVSFNSAMLLLSAFAVPMTLKAIIELDVLEIIAQAGPGAHLSAAEIASIVSTTNQQAPVTLDRMLSYLASHSVLTCLESATGDGSVERRYGIAPVCKFFIENKQGGSLAASVVLSLSKSSMDSWQQLKYAVLDGDIPFKKAHGEVSVFEKFSSDPTQNRVFNQAMSAKSTLVMSKMLDVYLGLQGIKKLVDVGGVIGKTAHMMVSKFPDMKVVNFDLPHVISAAPSFSGVEHVEGDMFVNVPNGDAIFLMRVLHNWSDEHCLKLLKNCFCALPSFGKLIIVDYIKPDFPKTDALTQVKLYNDLCMLTFQNGKNRTKAEFQLLAKEAGFSVFNVACLVCTLSVIELLK